MEKLTAIIPTGNEEHNIVDAIKSVAFADEIMVVDSFSSDRTIELAKPLADIILQREYENSASQKNWAIPQAKHNWILLLDADERVTTKLKKEVLSSINSNTDYSAFWIKRQHYFMGKKVSFSGWQGDESDTSQTQMLQYDKFVVPLIKAVQELSQQVEDLKKKVN